MTMPERPERPPSTSDGGTGLTSKVGPLPVWAWLAITAAGGVVVLLWLQNRRKAAPSTTDSGSVSPATSDVANLQDQLATVNSQIRDLQGQPSTPLPATPRDRNIYTFKLAGNPDNLNGVYAGVPGVGWYWIPTPEILNSFTNNVHPIYLGPITQDAANTRFGTRQDWSAYNTSVGVKAGS